MSGMSASLQVSDVVLRLMLTVVVGILIGFNRSEYGKATTLLVALAACVAMIEVNLLLNTNGRPPDSYMMNDSMRLPLGILTGVGFIGAGAILRRDNMVVGVTTAATLWLVTVIGLCIGGGQIELGLAATVLGWLALWGLRWIEDSMHHQFGTRFSIALNADGPGEPEVRRRLTQAGFSIISARTTLHKVDDRRDYVFELKHSRKLNDTETPAAIMQFADEAGVLNLHWDATR
jgi:putative Mg2+ transporter-C (MgtC) family protein